MKNLNMKTAIKRYNGIMNGLGYEHNTIGTALSEDTENWNLRDMVAECDYTLSTYYESGHSNEELRYSDEAEERKMWKSDVGKLERFINTYKSFTENMTCFSGHCSKYD